MKYWSTTQKSMNTWCLLLPYLHHTILSASCCIVAGAIVLVEGVVVWPYIVSCALHIGIHGLVDREEMNMPSLVA